MFKPSNGQLQYNIYFSKVFFIKRYEFNKKNEFKNNVELVK